MLVQAEGVRFIDVEFLGHAGVIATAVIDGPDGVALVDPGPTTSRATLEAGVTACGFSHRDIRAILLTHIHLDHAGVTGSLVRDMPWLRVYVHERGAKHLIDPARLIDSATRLYGVDGMDRLWGDFLAVPTESVHALVGGEQLRLCGREIDVAYTPGHASHHVSYFDASTGLAYTGDVGGGRLGASTFVMPPTPPPDIDLAAWQVSLDAIAQWRPAHLFVTHFGPSPLSGIDHVHQLKALLPRIADFGRDAMTQSDSLDAQLEHFRSAMRTEFRRHMSEDDAVAYELVIPLDHCFFGLLRYWQKQGVGQG